LPQTFVKEYRVRQPEAVFAETLDGDVHVKADVCVHYAEGDGRRGAVLVADDLLRVEVVNALVFSGLAAEFETLPYGEKRAKDVFFEVAAGEKGRLAAGIVSILARLGADV